MFFRVAESNLCQSPVFIDCSCATGGREGLLLVCNGLPNPKKEDLTSIRVLHIYIKGKWIPDTIQYNPKVWPRMRSMENRNKSLTCGNGLCSIQTIDVHALSRPNYVSEKMNLLSPTEEMKTEFNNLNALTTIKGEPIPTTTHMEHGKEQTLDKTSPFIKQQVTNIVDLEDNFEDNEFKISPFTEQQMEFITDLQNNFEGNEATTVMGTEYETFASRHYSISDKSDYEKPASSQYSTNKTFFISGLSISVSLNVALAIILLITCLIRRNQTYQETCTHEVEMLETNV